MGVCRCTYKDCSVKTNGEVHMFHYPVFDKVRCHKWLTNAQKMNFLDLKLSQLKNRLICQHHFTDDNFMNFKKNRLKQTAVPTEDGPFCTPNYTEKVIDKIFPITLEDIENDQEQLTPTEKRANFSVTYGEFLTNDVTDTFKLNQHNNQKIVTEMHFIDKYENQLRGYNPPLLNISSGSIINKNTNSNEATDLNNKATNITNENTTSNNVVPIGHQNIFSNPQPIEIEFKTNDEFNTIVQNTRSNDKINLLIDSQNNTNNYIPSDANISKRNDLNESTITIYSSHEQKSDPSKIHPSKKVKIISEKQIYDSIKLEGKLEFVSPTTDIHEFSRKKKEMKYKKDEDDIYIVPEKANDFDSSIQGTSSESHSLPVLSQAIDCAAHTSVIGQQQAEEFSQPLVTTQITEGLTDSFQSKVMLENNKTPIPFQYVQCDPLPQSAIVHYLIPDLQNTTNPLILLNNMSAEEPKLQNSTDTDSTRNKPKEFKSNNGRTSSRNSLANKSVLKNKIPPEKLAAIEEKRKYNIKLRDIINSCLHKLDEQQEPTSNLSATMKRQMHDKKVGAYLSRDPDLPSSQENIIAYLETRLQRLENILLNKIDKNSQKILELKNAIEPQQRSKNGNVGKSAIFTQTYSDEESSKRHLYNEISQYLTPETNSLIYEQLFIEKHTKNLSNMMSPRKKRKR